MAPAPPTLDRQPKPGPGKRQGNARETPRWGQAGAHDAEALRCLDVEHEELHHVTKALHLVTEALHHEELHGLDVEHEELRHVTDRPLRSLAPPAQAPTVAPPLPDRHPVLLVHGIWDSGAAFGRMSRYLRGRGFEVGAIDLVPNDGAVGLETLATQIAAYVDAELTPGSPLDLVGFSMGGVVSRYYVQRLGGVERVRRLVTISSPHHGTATAYLSRRPGSVQMRPDSALLSDLNGDLAALERVDFTSIWTPLDLMILPPDSSRLPPGREVLVAAPLHRLMLHDPRALRAVADALSAPLSARAASDRPASAA